MKNNLIVAAITGATVGTITVAAGMTFKKFKTEKQSIEILRKEIELQMAELAKEKEKMAMERFDINSKIEENKRMQEKIDETMKKLADEAEEKKNK